MVLRGSRHRGGTLVRHLLRPLGKGECEETPLWLQLRGSRRAVLNEVERVLGLQATDDINFPIRLKTGVSYEELLGDVVAQLRLIVDTIEATPDAD